MQKVVIAQRTSPGEELDLEELVGLCRTAGYEVVHSLQQKRKPHPKYNLGPGKARELLKIVKKNGISKVVIEDNATPTQEYNLAKMLGAEVASRTTLILEIFAKHASSAEAKLQIQLAKLNYDLSRAKEKVRLAARSGEQPGFGGLGGYDADVYYNDIRRKISTINRKLEALRRRRVIARKRRRRYGVPSVAIVGYTNAGKSTLFNALSSETKPVDSQLFTTLSTTTRIIEANGKKVFLSDTVGFIRNLPTLLIEAFHSTLEEIGMSDLILLVVDISDPMGEVREKIAWSINILREIGVFGIPVLLVLNKIDKVGGKELREKISLLETDFQHVAVSSLARQKLTEISNRISSMVPGYVRVYAVVENNGRNLPLLSRICERSNVIDFNYSGDEIKVRLEAPDVLAEKLRKISSSFKVER